MSTDATELSTTIEHLNKMLDDEKLSVKERLSITDRLLKAYALRYRWAAEGKGGKFSPLPTKQ